jgi:hypothetical protein
MAMTQLKRLIRTVATIAVVGAVTTAGLLAAGVPAQAADITVAQAKVEITRRIDLRLAALARFDVETTRARHLTDAHRATLHSLIKQDIAGLVRLRVKVRGETMLSALRADATSMVNDYRVFLLVGPKVRLSFVGDTEDFAIDRLHKVHDTLAALVAKAKAAGKDTSTAEQELADMQTDLNKASADIDGQVTALLAIQPGPDGPGITAKVTAVRHALGAGRTDIRAAVTKAKQVRDFLKSLT